MIKNRVIADPDSNVKFTELQPKATINAILVLLERFLPVFRTEYMPMVKSATNYIREDEISRELSVFLNSRINTFYFNFHEKFGVDFQILVEPFQVGAEPIFMVEAKRLPSSNNGRQYVANNDGIERFKQEQELFAIGGNHCAMLGYVQQNDFAYWLERINGWIVDLFNSNDNKETIWDEQDKLVALQLNNLVLGRYVSSHSRKTLHRLTIHHFWLDLRRQNPFDSTTTE